jgi:hypothetical protein
MAAESIVHMNELSSADRDILRNAIRVVRSSAKSCAIASISDS